MKHSRLPQTIVAIRRSQRIAQKPTLQLLSVLGYLSLCFLTFEIYFSSSHRGGRSAVCWFSCARLDCRSESDGMLKISSIVEVFIFKLSNYNSIARQWRYFIGPSPVRMIVGGWFSVRDQLRSCIEFAFIGPAIINFFSFFSSDWIFFSARLCDVMTVEAAKQRPRVH